MEALDWLRRSFCSKIFEYFLRSFLIIWEVTGQIHHERTFIHHHFICTLQGWHQSAGCSEPQIRFGIRSCRTALIRGVRKVVSSVITGSTTTQTLGNTWWELLILGPLAVKNVKSALILPWFGLHWAGREVWASRAADRSDLCCSSEEDGPETSTTSTRCPPAQDEGCGGKIIPSVWVFNK